MKLGAHPLIVAAALGLLGPLALAEDEEEPCERRPRTPCKGCTCDRAAPGVEPLAPAEVEAWVDAAWEALLR
jgi:hypothetical protein